MKKSVSRVLILEFALMLMLFFLAGAYALGSPAISMQDTAVTVTATAGGTATVPVLITDNPGFAGMDLTFSIPTEWSITAIPYITVNNEYSIFWDSVNYQPIGSVVVNPANGTFLASNSIDYTGSGFLCWIKYAVPLGTETGTYPVSVTANKINTATATGINIQDQFTFTGATVAVTGVDPTIQTVSLAEPSCLVSGGASPDQTIQATAISAKGTDITSKVAWSVSPATTGVTVDATGLVTVGSKAAAGTYTVTASMIDGKTLGGPVSATLTVTRAASIPTTVKIYKDGAQTPVGTDDTIIIPESDITNIYQYSAKTYDQYDEYLDSDTPSFVMQIVGSASVYPTWSSGVLTVTKDVTKDSVVTLTASSSGDPSITAQASVTAKDIQITWPTVTPNNTPTYGSTWADVVQIGTGGSASIDSSPLSGVRFYLSDASGVDLSSTIPATGVQNCYLTMTGSFEGRIYEITRTTPINMTVAQKEVGLIWSGYTGLTYNGTAVNVTATATQLVNGDSCTVTVTGGTETNAGTYTATTTALSNSNYKLPAAVTQSYVIAKAPLTITANPNTVIYGDLPDNAGVTYSGFVNAETETTAAMSGTLGYAYSYAQFDDVGTYTITPSGADYANYAEAYNTGDLTVAQKEVGLSWSGYTGLTYDGSQKNVTATATQLVNGDSCTVTVTGGTETNAGTYTATTTALSNSNYKLPAAVTQSYVIDKAPLTITANPNTVIYGDLPGNAGVTYSGFVNGENGTIASMTGTLTYAYDYVQFGDVGHYTITPSGADYANYAEAYNTGDLTVEKKEVGLIWSGYTGLTYNGTAVNVTATATQLVNGDSCMVTVTGGTETNAGPYTATATSLDNSNYKLPAAVTQSYVIAKAPLTITANPNTVIYGDLPDNAGVTYSGFVNAETETTAAMSGTLGYAYSYAQFDDVGTYTITPSGADYANYAEAYNTGDLTVAQKEVGLSWSGYTGLTYDGSQKNVTATATQLVNGDSCMVTVTGGNETNVGTYTVTATSLSNSNYKLPALVTQSYVIAKATVKFSFNNGSVRIVGYIPDNVGSLLPADTKSGFSFSGWSFAGVDGVYTSLTDGLLTALSDLGADPVEATPIFVPIPISGGGMGGLTQCSITLAASENGAVTSDLLSAANGDKVALTVKPDKYFALNTLLIADKSGNPIAYIDADGVYSFEMPGSDVTVSATFKFANPFKDVFEPDYFFDSVKWAILNGVTNGVSDAAFAPYDVCTRAQTVTFLWRAAGEPEPLSSICPFIDVLPGAYYYKAVLWAYEEGITLGTSQTAFSPFETVTRGQVVTFLWRYEGKPAATAVNPFSDVAANAYYYDAVLWAVEKGITDGVTPATFNPLDPCLRGQIVTFLYRDLNQAK